MLNRFNNYFIQTRRLLANKQALFVLSLLGLISGVAVGMVISLFRLSMEVPQAAFLPGHVENYEALHWQQRLLLASIGGLVLGLLFFLVSRTPLRVGILHVLERLSYNEGHLPLKNMIMQFVGGVIAVVSGQSVGREGPSVHLGAGTASLFGQFLRLPNNSIRTLVGCGTAAAVAAAFNTPLAGVIFAMEVILMEYTIAGFTPVILAAVSATVISRLVFGTEEIFLIQDIALGSLLDLPVVVVMGIVMGAVASIFIRITRIITDYGLKIVIWLRMSLAGLFVGLIALVSPEVMGVGYDTVNAVMLGQLSIMAMAIILVAKLLATSVCVGFSIPGGLISPSLVIGAVVGGMLAHVLTLFGVDHSGPGLYALLGAGAMMSATLQAPLAALLALLELTGSHEIVFPAMLAVVSANLTAQEVFKSESFFLSQFKQFGLDYRNDPIAQHLRRIGLESVINKSFVIAEPVVDRHAAITYLKDNPDWVLIRRKDDSNLLMPAADLARFLENDDADKVDLLEIPAKRRQLAAVSLESTLQHAQQVISSTEAEAVYAVTRLGQSADRINGIITPEDIEKQYRTVAN